MNDREWATHLWQMIDGRGISQNSFARLIGVSNATVSNWCSGKTKPKLSDLQKIKRILGCTWEDLMEGDISGR